MKGDNEPLTGKFKLRVGGEGGWSCDLDEDLVEYALLVLDYEIMTWVSLGYYKYEQ